MTNLWKTYSEADLKLKELHAEHLSFAEIGQRLTEHVGVTISRNAAIGRARRLGLVMPGARVPKVRSSVPLVVKRNARQRFKPRLVVVPEPIPDKPSSPVTIHGLTNSTCRWPLWNDAGDESRFYCGAGADVSAGRVYCVKHSAIAFGPSNVRAPSVAV